MTGMTNKTHFAPQLFIASGVSDISFYVKAFGTVELRVWRNDDNSIHVAELAIDGAIFHLHEEKPTAGRLDPNKVKGI